MASCIDSASYSQGEAVRAAAVSQAALIRKVAAVAIALDNAARLVANYKDQRDISKRVIAISEAQQNQLRTVFWPREEQFLAEFANPEVLESIEDMGRRYAGRMLATLAGGFALQLKEARCRFSRHCTSANKKVMQDLLMARGVAMANARVLGRNIAFAEYQARTDRNLQRRIQAVSLGRGLMQQAVSLYEAAGRGVASAGNILSGQLNSAIESFGYADRDYSAQFESDIVRKADALYKNKQQSAGAVAPDPYATADSGYFTGDFGYQSGNNLFTNPQSANTFDFSVNSLSTQRDVTPQQGLQVEKWNEGDIGNRDLIRTGSATFPVVGITGGSVTVNMSAFPLKYADDLTEGDTTT